MPTGLLDCSGWGQWILNEDGKFVPIRDIQTVTLSQDPANGDDVTVYGADYWEEGSPYHYTLVSDMTFEATIRNVGGMRRLLKLAMPPRSFRRWVRRQEKERRRRLKEAHND